MVEEYIKSKGQIDKNLSDGLSLFLYFKAIYPNYKLIFPTILRLVFPLPKEHIIDTINFVAQNICRDSWGKNTINLSKIAKFYKDLSKHLEVKYKPAEESDSQGKGADLFSRGDLALKSERGRHPIYEESDSSCSDSEYEECEKG